jgi:hypothetical protein
MRDSFRVLALRCVVWGAALVSFAACAGPQPPLPPLLQNVTAGSGWWGACPPETAEEARLRDLSPLALSPELDERVARSFPIGSSEMVLVDTLRAQGFELRPSCKGDQSIHAAEFEQHPHGLLPYPLTAKVFWKVDSAGNIEWTKAFVRYSGL